MARFRRITFSSLNGRQKENYNYQKLSAVLADYGFVTTRLTDDWQGGDILAHHIDGKSVRKIQLKGRLSFAKKYEHKEIFIAFFDRVHEGEKCYLYSHDELLAALPSAHPDIKSTKEWRDSGGYHVPNDGLSQRMRTLLDQYNKIGETLEPPPAGT